MRSLGEAPCLDSFAKLFLGEYACGNGLAIRKLRGMVAALGVKTIQQTDRTSLVGVLTDVAIFLHAIEIPRALELQNTVTCLQALVGIATVREDLIVRHPLLCSCD